MNGEELAAGREREKKIKKGSLILWRHETNRGSFYIFRRLAQFLKASLQLLSDWPTLEKERLHENGIRSDFGAREQGKYSCPLILRLCIQEMNAITKTDKCIFLHLERSQRDFVLIMRIAKKAF